MFSKPGDWSSVYKREDALTVTVVKEFIFERDCFVSTIIGLEAETRTPFGTGHLGALLASGFSCGYMLQTSDFTWKCRKRPEDDSNTSWTQLDYVETPEWLARVAKNRTANLT